MQMSVKKIDISKYCNHKLIYENLPEGESYFGLDNICILKQDFLSKYKTLKQGDLYNYCLGNQDNIACDGQRIFIGSKVKRWHFIGFAYWGDVNEIINVIFDDDTEDWIDIAFIEWSRLFVHGPWSGNLTHDNKIENVRVAVTAGDMIHLVYFHDCVCEFSKEKTVKEIILPNNILVHIFALTIEY